MTDFGVYYQGGKRILGGETLYSPSDVHPRYLYSPASAALFSLLTLLPYELSKFVWYLSQIFLLWLVLLFSYDFCPSKQKRKGVVIVLSFLVLLKFFAREIELGQINLLILFLLLMMARNSLQRNDMRGGLFWGFSLYFKPYGLVFLPYYILKKRISLYVSGIGILVLGFCLPIVFYGFKSSLSALKGWQKNLSLSASSFLDNYDNASLLSFFLKNISAKQGGLAWILFIFSVLIICFSLLVMMFMGRRKGLEKPEILEISYLFVLIPLFSPLAWYYIYLYSALAVVLLMNYIDKFPKALRYVLIANFISIGATLIEIMGKTAFRFYTQHSLVVISYLIILLYLFYLRIKGIA